MVSRKASAPKRAAATQKLSKKAATATERAKVKAKASKSKSKTNGSLSSSKKAAEPARADASALATTSKGAGVGVADKHSDRGKVLYVGHLPHGFYEEQLRGYFSQFGAVTRVRLSRVKKTGKPKSYAFLEFASPAVAAIAADAMDGYLLFSQRLSVKVLSPESVHPALFKGADRVFTKVPWRKLEAGRVNKKLSADEAAKRAGRAARADEKRAERIEKAGIDYQYERLLESILEDGEEPGKKKEAPAGKKSKAATSAVVEEEQPAKKKAKTAATKKKPAAKKAAAAAPAAKKKAAVSGSKREPAAAPAAATTATRSSKRARG